MLRWWSGVRSIHFTGLLIFPLKIIQHCFYLLLMPTEQLAPVDQFIFSNKKRLLKQEEHHVKKIGIDSRRFQFSPPLSSRNETLTAAAACWKQTLSFLVALSPVVSTTAAHDSGVCSLLIWFGFPSFSLFWSPKVFSVLLIRLLSVFPSLTKNKGTLFQTLKFCLTCSF